MVVGEYIFENANHTALLFITKALNHNCSQPFSVFGARRSKIQL